MLNSSGEVAEAVELELALETATNRVIRRRRASDPTKC